MRDRYDNDVGGESAHMCLQAMAAQQPIPINYDPYDSSEPETYPNSIQVDVSDMSSSDSSKSSSEDVPASNNLLLNQNLRSIHLSDSDGQSTDTDLSDDAYPIVRGKVVRTDKNRAMSLPPTTPKPPPEPLDLLLFDIMCDHLLSKSVMRDLSTALNKHTGLPLARMPKDRKTLLNRHLKKGHVVVESDTFLYIGVSYSLNDMYLQNKRRFELHEITDIKLSFNFDGLPTSRSTSQEVWPILMSTNVAPILVHIVGVYYGKEKPTCVSLLRQLVDELGPILRSGYVFPDGLHLQVTIDYIVCDLPALALVKFFKNACGYAACAKCTVYGEHYKKTHEFHPQFS